MDCGLPEEELDCEFVVRTETTEQEITFMEVDDDFAYPIEYSIDSLPSEILGRVFAYLPLKNRNNARLVCKRWYANASCGLMAKKEKFIFRATSEEEDIIKILQSEFVRPNLEFQGLVMDSDEFPAHVWDTCGFKIQSLFFHECLWIIKDDILKNIIIQCVNLRSLTIVDTDCAGEARNFLSYSQNVVDDLIAMGIERPKLYALSLLIYNYEITPNDDEILNKFFLIFPSIKYFRFGFPHELEEVIVEEETWDLKTELSPISVDKFRFLTNLAINYYTFGSWIEDYLKLESNFKLTEFEAMIVCQSSFEKTLLEFFTAQNNLKTVKLKLAQTINDFFLKLLFFHILENCAELRNFSMDSDTKIHFTSDEELIRFFKLTRNLQFLNIKCFILNCSKPDFINTIPPQPIISFSLTALVIQDSNISKEILKRCPLLKHLELRNSCNESLQIIFKYLSCLQTLILTEMSKCTNDGFLGRGLFQNEGYSISQLQKLKFLELSTSGNTEITAEIICKLRCPDLEDLSLQIVKFELPSGNDELTELASNIPDLRSIKVIMATLQDPDLDYCHAFQKQLLDFCRHFKNLYYLDFRGAHVKFLTESELSKLLDVCPSLRHISDLCIFQRAISFDPVTRKIDWVDGFHFRYRWNYLEYSNYFSTIS